MPETADLICEGSCNPGIKDLDRAVRTYRVGEIRSSTGYFGPMDDRVLLGALRTLKHTAHERVSPEGWQCVVCRQVRKF